MLSEAIDRVEAGLTDGIVVAKLDRFGRSPLDSLAAIERIQLAGGTFVAVQDGLDMSTDTGKLVLRIMLSMAEWELDRIRSQWNSARERAVARGVHMGARAPTGYVRDAKRALHPDPITSPFITELFAKRAQGATIRALGTFLAEHDVKTPFGNPNWVPAALHGVIKNRVYLGELHHGTMIKLDSHPPLTDPVTWQAAQDPRTMERRKVRHTPTVLGGLLRCAGCRMAMHSHTATTPNGLRRRYYFCGGRSSAGDCQSRAWISGAVAEPYVDAAFFALAARHHPKSQTDRMRRLVKAHEHAAQELAEYRDSPNVLTSLGHELFAEGLAKRHERAELAMLAVASQRAKAETKNIGTGPELESCWPTLNAEERREIMGELIDCVFVFRREVGRRERLFVCARGDAPVDLPHRGRRSKGLIPFQPEGIPCAAPATDESRWTKQQISTSLDEFLSAWSGSRWPVEEEFIFAGRGPLLRQINRTGGSTQWTRGTSWSHLRRAEWTEERIRVALPVILAGRTQWPTRPEFKAQGYDGLYSALGRRGRREWADEFGLEYRNTGGAAVRWTEPRIIKALTRLCAGRELYPSQGDFAAKGLAGLYVAIASRYGGHDKWAAKVGLQRPAQHRTAKRSITR